MRSPAATLPDARRHKVYLGVARHEIVSEDSSLRIPLHVVGASKETITSPLLPTEAGLTTQSIEEIVQGSWLGTPIYRPV